MVKPKHIMPIVERTVNSEAQMLELSQIIGESKNMKRGVGEGVISASLRFDKISIVFED